MHSSKCSFHPLNTLSPLISTLEILLNESDNNMQLTVTSYIDIVLWGLNIQEEKDTDTIVYVSFIKLNIITCM